MTVPSCPLANGPLMARKLSNRLGMIKAQAQDSSSPGGLNAESG
jgi:hypothetical protein